jgi:recombinational DNA repair protein (RecF pathway)
MGGNDPHIHVEAKVVHGDAAVRNMVASTFGLAGDLPSLVATGCGLRVPYAMTSPRTDRVTCLACREHARREHLRFAEEVERLSRMPGSTISPAQGKLAADRHRDLAQRFSDTEG